MHYKGMILAMGETKLRIKKHKVGMHSLRSGAAMAMYMGEVPIFAMLLAINVTVLSDGFVFHK
jgi:hypothetical protein